MEELELADIPATKEDLLELSTLLTKVITILVEDTNTAKVAMLENMRQYQERILHAVEE